MYYNKLKIFLQIVSRKLAARNQIVCRKLAASNQYDDVQYLSHLTLKLTSPPLTDSEKE